ncbi:MAG TPA: helix-turn-helix domain-containing protein [Candidatus Saccharimonadales bacterium]|nr:helix-turn-helix domain-containing protein [Candidatus Saccharimonadales bacterium]
MTELIRLKKRLEKFGLSPKQAEIYVYLIQSGNSRISEIVRNLKIPRSSVYENLKGLKQQGLVEELIENNYRTIQAYSIGLLKDHLDEQMTKLETQIGELNNLEKVMEVIPGIKPSPPVRIRYYEGKSGAQQLFWNSLKAKDTLYVYSEWGRGRFVGIKFYKNFVTESYRRNIKEHVLTNPLPRIAQSMKEHTGSPLSRTDLTNIRFIDEAKIRFRGETLIYDNIYAQIYLKHNLISGFEIESPDFTQTQRAIFEGLWEPAGPVLLSGLI